MLATENGNISACQRYLFLLGDPFRSNSSKISLHIPQVNDCRIVAELFTNRYSKKLSVLDRYADRQPAN